MRNPRQLSPFRSTPVSKQPLDYIDQPAAVLWTYSFSPFAWLEIVYNVYWWPPPTRLGQKSPSLYIYITHIPVAMVPAPAPPPLLAPAVSRRVSCVYFVFTIVVMVRQMGSLYRFYRDLEWGTERE